MSTKIYYGRRLLRKNIGAFLEEINVKIFKIAKNHVKELKKTFSHEKVMEIWLQLYPDGSKEIYSEHFPESIIKALAYTASEDTRKNVFCLDFSINLWPHEDYFYVIPYGEQFYLSKLKYNRQNSEEYVYADNTDKPNKYSIKEWDQRYQNWTNCCLNNWHTTRLVHEIINVKQYIGTDQLFKNPVVFEKQAKKITEILFPSSFISA